MKIAKQLLSICELDTTDYTTEVFELTKELTLKQSGSTYVFKKGTLIPVVTHPNGKFSASNTQTVSTLDALTGTVSPTKIKKVKANGKSLGTIEANKARLNKELSPPMRGGFMSHFLK